MPGFGGIGESAVNAIARYLMTGEAKEALAVEQDPRLTLKYTLDGYVWFQDAQGYPAVQPPWGTLTAINLDDGNFAWRKPFGEYPELVQKGMPNTGSQNYGGSVATAGGLLFIGATLFDDKFHAYDKKTGELLWETVLPAAGASSPAVYEAGGKQFVLIGAGGGKFGGKSGGTYHAFALPLASSAKNRNRKEVTVLNLESESYGQEAVSCYGFRFSTPFRRPDSDRNFQPGEVSSSCHPK
jgi:quinoprotein glucose dehydrogenase